MATTQVSKRSSTHQGQPHSRTAFPTHRGGTQPGWHQTPTWHPVARMVVNRCSRRWCRALARRHTLGFQVLLLGVGLERAIFPPEVRGKTQEG